MKTALNQLEKWILDYEKVNGTPTMCEIKAQLEMFKEIEKQQIIDTWCQNAWIGNVPIKERAEQYYNETFN